MEIVKKATAYTIIKKGNGRFGVRSKNRTWISGEEKVKILVKEGLATVAAQKPASKSPVEEDAPSAETPPEG